MLSHEDFVRHAGTHDVRLMIGGTFTDYGTIMDVDPGEPRTDEAPGRSSTLVFVSESPGDDRIAVQLTVPCQIVQAIEVEHAVALGWS